VIFSPTVALAIFLPRLQARPAPITVQSQGPTIQRLERLSHLVTSRVSVANVLVGEGEGWHVQVTWEPEAAGRP
jgi:hypothetical protein